LKPAIRALLQRLPFLPGVKSAILLQYRESVRFFAATPQAPGGLAQPASATSVTLGNSFDFGYSLLLLVEMLRGRSCTGLIVDV